MPPCLARKRVWNRKYPICITVARAEELTEEVEDQQDPHCNEKSALSPSKTNHNITLYLFARTGREKEEWFHHLCAASMYRNEAQYESGKGSSVCDAAVIVSKSWLSIQLFILLF